MRRGKRTEVDRLVAEGAGRVVRTEKRCRCACCARTIPAGYMLTRPGGERRICGSCVAGSWMDAYPQEKRNWSPEDVCTLLNGDASERIKGICACARGGWRSGSACSYGSGWYGISPLAQSVEVIRGLLECAAFPGDTWTAGIVRLLSASQAREILDQGRTWSILTNISPRDPAQLIKGTVSVLVGGNLDQAAKVRWLHGFRNYPDPDVVSEIEATLRILGVSGFEQAQEILELRPLIDDMLDAFKADELRNVINTLRRLSGILISGTTKEAMATGLARSFGSDASMQALYDSLTPAQKTVVNYLAWQKSALSPDQIRKKTGILVVTKQEGSRYARVVLGNEFAGLLTCETHYYGDRTSIQIHPWFRHRLKPVLPVPEKARLRGAIEPPSFPECHIFRTGPTFVNLFPALDAMCQQGVIPRKKNGEPTAAALRSLQAAGWDIEAGHPRYQQQNHSRLEMLIRLADNAPEVTVPRTEPADVLRAWLDALTQPAGSETGAAKRRTKRQVAFQLPLFMKHLKGVTPSRADGDDAAVCLRSLNMTIKAIPEGQWVTFRDLCDFMLYNDLNLPIPYGCMDAYVSTPTEWGGREHQHIITQSSSRWEEPLLRTFLLVLTAVGAVDAVIAPSQDETNARTEDDCMLTSDTLKAVRLTSIGEWYFRDGPDTCLEAQAKGEVILDGQRLLIRLTGSNPVLQVALEQVAQPLAGGFYRIDGGSFLKDCASKAHVERKVDILRSLLPDALPPIWEEFFENLLLRINPLNPVDFVVLEVGDSAEFRQLLLADPALRTLSIMAEGGRILVKPRDGAKLKKRLRELGYFIDSF